MQGDHAHLSMEQDCKAQSGVGGGLSGPAAII